MILAMTMAAALMVQTGQATPPRRARASLNQYFSTDDYPPTAAARGAQGTVSFRLSIGADGAVTGCTITQSAGDAALDAATCAILLGRARYAPARDAAGRAVPGKDSGRVTWRLPAPEPGRPFALFRTVSRLRSDGAGQVDCVVTTNGVVATDATPTHCGDLADGDAYAMLRRVPVSMEVTLVSVAGPVAAAVQVAEAGEANYGALQYDQLSDLVIGQNGRITECRIATTNIPPSSLFPEITGGCELPPGAGPMFEPSTDPAPRHARHRYALYIKGWPADAHMLTRPVVAPRPTPPRP